MTKIEDLNAKLTRVKTLYEQKEARFNELDKELTEAGLTKDVDPDTFFKERQDEIDRLTQQNEDEKARIAEELVELEARLT